MTIYFIWKLGFNVFIYIHCQSTVKFQCLDLDHHYYVLNKNMRQGKKTNVVICLYNKIIIIPWLNREKPWLFGKKQLKQSNFHQGIK